MVIDDDDDKSEEIFIGLPHPRCWLANSQAHSGMGLYGFVGKHLVSKDRKPKEESTFQVIAKAPFSICN